MRKRDDHEHVTKTSRSKIEWDIDSYENTLNGYTGKAQCQENYLTYNNGINAYIGEDCHLYQGRDDYKACNSASGTIDDCNEYHKNNPKEYDIKDRPSCPECGQPHKALKNCPSCRSCPLRKEHGNNYCAIHNGTRCKTKGCHNKSRQNGICIHHMVQSKLGSYVDEPEKWKIDNDFLYVNLNATTLEETMRLLNDRLYELGVLFTTSEEVHKNISYKKYSLTLHENSGQYKPDRVIHAEKFEKLKNEIIEKLSAIMEPYYQKDPNVFLKKSTDHGKYYDIEWGCGQNVKRKRDNTVKELTKDAVVDAFASFSNVLVEDLTMHNVTMKILKSV